MGWEELVESLDDLETKEVYNGYFCSVKDAVVIIILGCLCGLQNFKQIHEWAITEHVRAFLEKEFGIKRIPCYWWLLSLIALVTPESLNLCMKNFVPKWIHSLQKITDMEGRKSGRLIQLMMSVGSLEAENGPD